MTFATCRAILAIGACVAGIATRSAAPPAMDLRLGAYQQPDGAITVFPDGLFVEPYFAMRALVAGVQLGLNADSASRRWIAWQMPRLYQSAVFTKDCRTPGTTWAGCGAADAEDAALALWIELLYRTAGPAGLPSAWRRSAMDADTALAALLDPQTGVYIISHALPVSLFMDNIEIAGAFDAVSQAQDAAGDHAGATRNRVRSASLRRAIDRVFWDKANVRYRITTQRVPATPSAFYPDHVAQLFPALFGYGSPADQPAQLYSRWIARYRDEWLARPLDEYPWGLIAAAAPRYGDSATAICWLGTAIALRHGRRWNVLEEAVFQGLAPAFAPTGAVPPCEAARVKPARA